MLCRNHNQYKDYRKEDYMKPMRCFKEICEKIAKGQNVSIYHSSFESSLDHELLIEKLLLFYPQCWNEDLLTNVKSDTTIQFIDTVLQLKPQTQYLNMNSTLASCLRNAFSCCNLRLAKYLCDKGVMLNNYDVRYLYSYHKADLHYFEILISCDRGWYDNVSDFVYYTLYKRSDLAHEKDKINLIKYFVSKGLKLKDVREGELIKKIIDQS